MKKFLQFGAGNIGRSLVGEIFARAGYEVCFVDALPEVVAALNARRSYVVRIKDDLPPGAPAELTVNNVRGLAAGDTAAVTRAVAEADLIGTSVGAGVLPKIWPTLAAGLAQRQTPVSILFCENWRGVAQKARAALRELLPAGYPLDERIGLVETSIGKMVPIMPQAVRAQDPLEVWAEAYNQIIADREAFIGPPPEIAGLKLCAHFEAYVDRKLFIHNLGHAAAAYLGFLAGHKLIWECLADPAVRPAVETVMRESARALARTYPQAFTLADLEEHVADLLRRFANRALGDTVFRVGRDLGRKLAPDDRCLGALRLVQTAGGDPAPFVRVIAAALRFRATDESGISYQPDVEFLAQLEREGLPALLTQHCGLDAARDASLLQAIEHEYLSLAPS